MPVAAQSATANSMIAATAATAAAIRVMPARVENEPRHESEGPPHRVPEQRDGRDGLKAQRIDQLGPDSIPNVVWPT